MTIEECYARMGADYEDVIRRLEKKERVIRFLSRFPEERSYETLCAAIAQGNPEEAFRAAHSLKGVCMNLGLTALCQSSSDLTEALRGGAVNESVPPLLDRVTRDYETVTHNIQELQLT